MTIDLEFLAYTAGFFDADGCVGIARVTRPENARGVDFVLTAHITQKLWMPILEEWRVRWGGCIYHSNVWIWKVHANGVVVFLQDILPHLRKKWAQVKLAIEFQKHKAHPERHRLTDAEFAYQEQCYEAMRALKKQDMDDPPEMPVLPKPDLEQLKLW